MTRTLAALGITLGVLLSPIAASADVVDSCPQIWQSGYEGHGMTCETNWPVIGGGGVCCAGAGLVIAGLLFLAARRPSAGIG